MNILQEADRITSVDRNDDYGHPRTDFQRTAVFWSAIFGFPVTPEQVALCMIALKLSREVHKHKRDSIVDIAGYARTLEMLYEKPNKNKNDVGRVLGAS
jgi:Domain of unknown function (DUF6378)